MKWSISMNEMALAQIERKVDLILSHLDVKKAGLGGDWQHYEFLSSRLDDILKALGLFAAQYKLDEAVYLQIDSYLENKNRHQAIKIFQTATGVSLREAMEAVIEIEKNLPHSS
jgi:hypothetical protein